jgi:hypothetical protein
MDFKKTAKLLILLGAGGVIISLIWFASLFGLNFFSYIGILFTGADKIGYTPVLLWISIVVLVIGVTINSSIKPPNSSHQ